MAEFKWNLPKYNVFELQNISKDDPEYVQKMSAKYGLTWGEDLSKKQYKKWNAVVNQQKDIYNKYQYTPDVNILSKGGEYQKYDDLINKILAQGKATKEDNELLFSYKNELGFEDVTSDPSQSVIRTKILSGDALTKREYSEFFGRLQNYELLPAWRRVGLSLGSAVLPAITALPELVGGKAQREVLQGRYADMKASARAGLDLTPTESFLWDTGESIVNNIASIVMGGKAAPYLMGTQAGVRKMSSVEVAGGTTFEAIASGLLAAGAEYLGERVSIKGLEQLAKVAPSTFRGIIKAAAGQVLSEATEEVATEMMNILSDFVVLDIIDKGGTQSDLKKYFDNYLKEHPEARGNTAFWKTFLQAVQQIALAGAAGAISGGVMGGGQIALNTMTTQGRQNMAMYGADQAYRQAYEQSLKTGQITPAMQQKVVNAQNLLNKRFDTQDATQPVTAQSVREYVAEQDYAKYSKDANSQAAIQKAVVANKITTKEMDAVDAFAKKTNINVKYEYQEGAPKGRYEGQTMVVNLAADKAKVSIAAHEYMHHLKDTDTARFESVSKSVLGLKQYDDVRQSVTERYTTAEETRGSIWTEENGVKKVNQPALDEEIAANIVEAIIDKPDRFIKDVTSKPVRSKVAKAILDIYNRAKDLFTSAEKKEVREAYNKIVRAVKGSEAEADKGAGKANTSDEKTRYSLSTDSQGRKLTEAQQEFFKNSKVRDEQGRLLEVYHGTNAEFTKFNKSMVGSNTGSRGFYGTGIYFATKKQDARNYGDNILNVYLNAKNLFDIDNKNWTYLLGLEKKPQYKEVRKTQLEDLGKGFYTIYYNTNINPNKWEAINRATSLQLSEGVKEYVEKVINPESKILPRDVKNLSELVQKKGYDGIIGSATNIGDLGKEIVVFSPSQIKLTTNLNPTASEDIRYSLQDSLNNNKDKLKGVRNGRSIYDLYYDKSGRFSEDTLRQIGELEKSTGLKSAEQKRRYAEIVRDFQGVSKKEINGEKLELVNKDFYVKALKKIENDNLLYRINTDFYINNVTTFNGVKVNGFTSLSGDNTYINLFTDINKISRHERYHQIRNQDIDEFVKLENRIIDELSELEAKTLYRNYADRYSGYYTDSAKIFEEIIADIYAGTLKVERQSKINKLLEEVDDIAMPYLDTRYSLDTEKADKHRNAAIKEFGYTPYFYDAGYLLPSGKMLNFSGKKGRHFGSRGKDHRGISIVFEDGELKGEYQSEGMISFMNEGNIRLQAETPGIDLYFKAEPTIEQYAIIRRFAELEGNKNEYFNVDFSNENGDNVGNIVYEGNIRSQRIVNDIKSYYKTGELPQQSEVDKFRYSLDTEKAKLRARTRPGKEYTRAEAKEIVDGLLGDEYKGKNLSALSKSNYNKAVERLYAGLNAAKEGRRAGVALGVADMLINSAQNDFTTAEKNEIRQSIAEEILQGYENKGKLTAFGETVQRYIGKVSSLKAQLKDAKAYGQSTVRLMNTVRLIKDLKGVAGAARNVAEEFKPITQAFKKISGTHQKGSEQVREAFKSYARKINGKPLYDILMDVEGQKNPFGDVIEAIASGKGQLSAEEINAANAVLRNYIHNAREYGKVLIGEQRQDAKELSQKGIGEEAAVKARAMNEVKAAARDYMDWTGTPIWTFRRMAGHDEGAVAMQMYYEIEEAINRRDAIERDMQMLFSDFFSKHGKEADKWKNARIDFAGTKISTGQAIALYLLSLREQAQAHLYNLKDDRGVIRLTEEKGRTSKDKYQRGKDVYFERTDIENLEKGFGEAEKAFIKLTQEFFGTLSKDKLNEAYNAMYGVDIANEKNYFPIHVSEDEIYREVGGKNPGDFGQLFSVRSPAFIKPTVEKAKNKVVVENAIDVINRHMHEVASFAALSIPMRNINRVLNAKQENGDTFLKALERVNPKFKDYLDKWLKDVQGIRTGDYTRVDRWIGKVRGMGARGALGLNPKVWVNQLVSLFAARGVGISYKNILYGGKQMFKAKKADFELLYKYVPMAHSRAREGGNIDVGLLKEGVGVIGKADKLTDLTTAPISKIDNLVVYGVWRAALKQLESQYTPNSEEHYKAAAELTKRALVETQANYTAFARPEILRTNNELVRLFTMFMSEPLQSFSQIAGSTDAVIAAKQARKSAVGEEQIKKADKILKERTARLKAVVISTTVQAILLTLITRMAVWLKGKKKDEEENFWAAAGMDMLENYVGMFPLVRDLYSVFQGYDVSNMFNTGLQNMGDALKTIYDISAGQGDMLSNLRKLVLGVSQTFGVPLRNLETYVMGVVDKFSPEAAYKYNSLFYSQTYKKNLDKAIKDSNHSMANTVMERYMDDKGFKLGSYATREFVRLYSKDALTLPTGLNNTVTVNGETIVMTTAQYQRFSNVYSQAGTVAQNIMTGPEYKRLSDEAKGKAISTVFDMFYAKAKTAVLKAEDYKYSALTAVPIRQLAPIAAAISAITASEESGSRRAQVMAIISKYGLTVAQRLFLMMYFGYTVKDGEFKGVSAEAAKAQVKAFVSGLSLSAKEKEYLLKKAGVLDLAA